MKILLLAVSQGTVTGISVRGPGVFHSKSFPRGSDAIQTPYRLECTHGYVTAR